VSGRRSRKAAAPERLAPPPRQTAVLLDQEAAEARLLTAEAGGRLPHAWLLTGPRGVGKATLAYRFARFLLAGGSAGAGEEGLFGAPPPPASLALDPEHPVFRRVASGGHPDILAVERGLRDDGRPKRDIDVDSVRQLNAFLRMTSAEGGWRIAVVDAADEMNPNAANALLKLLEEPPPRAVLLLVSHAPGRLLPTIRSRCRRLALAPLPEATVARLLRGWLPEAEEAELAALARLGEGSVGRAVELAEEGGLDLYRALLELLGQLPRLDSVKAHGFAEALARDPQGRSFRTTAELLLWWLGRLVQAAAVGRLPPEVVAGETEVAQRLLAGRGLADWVALWENLGRLFAQAERASLERKQVMLTALDRLGAATSA